METVVVILMLLVYFSFILKQSWRKLRSVILISLVSALFIGFSWPYAIEQSKTQISDWLSDTALMLDISVVLSIEVVLQMTFCMLAVHIGSSGTLGKRTVNIYRVLSWFPGLMIFPVLFSLLVYMIFSFPGVSFPLVAWSLAAGILVFIPTGSLLIRRMLPEKELRLEILFLTNVLVAVLGIIATVNGRTAVKGTAQIDWYSLAGVCAMTLAGAVVGIAFYHLKNKRNNKLNKL